MNISATQLYSFLTDKFDKQTAEYLTSFIEQKIHLTMIDRTNHFVTKEDLANTKNDIIRWLISIFLAVALMIIGLYFKK